MCGRFNFSNHSKVSGAAKVGIKPSYNIAPSSTVAVLNENGECVKLNWGFMPSWMKSGQIINAKSETVRAKPTFQGFRKCYVPINGWYEWAKTDNGKQPYYFYSDYDTLYVKSIMKDNTVVLLTTPAMENIAGIHHRMPLLNLEPTFKHWNLHQTEIAIHTHPISAKVNAVSNDGPELIAPIV